MVSADRLRTSTTGFRRRRMQQSFRTLEPEPGTPILDVGGTPTMWLDVGYEGPIVYVNIVPPDQMPPIPAGSTYVQADGCDLPFGPGEFATVFSNSVIEHVGDWDAQARFAREIERVGRRYWVQTPNRRFPIEPHLNFPCFQWLPAPAARFVVAKWPLSFHRRDGLTPDEAWQAVERTRLLSIGDMRRLFPGGTMWRENAFGLTKSIVAIRTRPSRDPGGPTRRLPEPGID